MSFSPDVAEWIPQLTAAINRHSFTMTLQPGQGVLLDNHRWLHARDTFEGPRQLYRLLGNPLPSLAMYPGIPVEADGMRFREDKPADLERARAAVAEWREQNSAGTEEQLIEALGSGFHPEYGPVLRAALFAVDRDRAGSTAPGPQHVGCAHRLGYRAGRDAGRAGRAARRAARL